MYGPHLMIDCYECDKEKLGSEKFILNFLKQLPPLLGMSIIKEPFIVPYENNPSTWDNGGVSAVVLIAESHISIHTFPDNIRYTSIDIFSCKHFDIEKTKRLVKAAFNPEKMEFNLVMRGKHFPRETEKVSPIIVKQRTSQKKKLTDN